MQFTDGNSLETIASAINNLTFHEAESAINQLSVDGITTDSELPFFRVVYNHAQKELCLKLNQLGCPFIPQVIGTHLYYEGSVYAIYDPKKFDFKSAVDRLKVHYEST